MTPNQAKDFLSRKILETARRNGVAFDNLEKEMLYWTSENEKDYLELNRKFSEVHNDKEYEEKVISLLDCSYNYDRTESPADLRKYKLASAALHRGDHYLSVMLDDSIGSGFKPMNWLRFGGESESIQDFVSLALTALVFGGLTIVMVFLEKRGIGFQVWIGFSLVVAGSFSILRYLPRYGWLKSFSIFLFLFCGFIFSYRIFHEVDKNFYKKSIHTLFFSCVIYFAVEMGPGLYSLYFKRKKSGKKGDSN